MSTKKFQLACEALWGPHYVSEAGQSKSRESSREGMKMKQLIAIGMVAVSVGACAMTQNIAELGPDTYTVGAAASPARGGASTARSMALQEAANFRGSKFSKRTSGTGQPTITALEVPM